MSDQKTWAADPADLYRKLDALRLRCSAAEAYRDAARERVDELTAALTAEKAARDGLKMELDAWKENSDAHQADSVSARAWAKAWKWRARDYRAEHKDGLVFLKAESARVEEAHAEKAALAKSLSDACNAAIERAERAERYLDGCRDSRNSSFAREDKALSDIQHLTACLASMANSRDEWKARAQGARREALEECKKAVDAEPEFPGEPPEEARLRLGLLPVVEVARVSVRLTKAGILARIQALSAKPEGGES